MNDLKRVSVVAVVLVVVLRLSIGWQFLYEGLWKHDTMDSSTPWSAEGYLKAAQGPFRDQFRGMTGDPDDLSWLDHATMQKKWADWRTRFSAHYQLNDAQQKQLAALMDPPGVVAVNLAQLPASVNPAKFPVDANKSPVLSYDPAKKQLSAPGPLLAEEVAALKNMIHVADLGDNVFAKTDAAGIPMREGGKLVRPSTEEIDFYKNVLELEQLATTPREKQRLAGLKATLGIVSVDETTFVRADDNGYPVRTGGQLVPADAKEVLFLKAIVDLEKKANTLSFTQRLTAMLSADPDRVGVVWRTTPKAELVMTTASAGSETDFNIKYGDVQAYKDLIEEYEAALAKAQVNFQFDHVERIGKKLAAKRAEVVGPVRQIDASMREAARKLLTPEQMALGAPAPEQTPVWKASQRAMWGLLILGTLLMLGLGTRVAALGGAVMLMSFYLVVPPWPGVPQPVGPEHSLIVNKNLIEVFALLVIAALPTGTWFGLDGLIRKLLARPAAAPASPGGGATKK